jgi:hypothetical protein
MIWKVVFYTNLDLKLKKVLKRGTVYANIFAAKYLAQSIFSRGIIFATESQNKPMNSWQILTKPRYRQRKNQLMSVHVYYIHTYAAWLGSTDDKHAKKHAVKITWKQQLPNKTVLIDHCTIHMREHNPVFNRINWIITAKSPNKFNNRTCRENLTTAYGNHVISIGGKIQIKHGGKF